MPDFDVGFVIFPGITQLDFTGPYEVLSRLGTPPSLSTPSRLGESRTHVIAKTLEPVSSDRGLRFLPTCTFNSSPELDLICIPGGPGTAEAIGDVATVDFVRNQGRQARFITSVCMGAFVLGAAGLLKGRRATTHWAYTDLLHLVGAAHEKARIVRDGNVFTSGGVTSGIDFAFHIVSEIAGSEVAQAIQLGIEYDPSPPFDVGHPDKASKEATALMRYRNEKARAGIVERLEKWSS
jgi:cyclohexyl-isocyanide hydratase